MAKRRQRGDNADDLLGELRGNETTASPFSSPTASDIADAGYDSLVGHDDGFKRLSRNREKIIFVDIESIQPNRTQPRRAIPSSVRQYWSGSSDVESMARFFQQWLDEINLERDHADRDHFPFDQYIIGKATPRSRFIDDEGEDQLEQIPHEKAGVKEAAMMPLIDLAASIKRDGLINPISVAKDGLLWQIETGERRWLAYHLLNWHENSSDEWRKIPTRHVESIDIWRQATENNARADLNAIATARQFALLLMDLRSQIEGDHYQPFEAFEHEQDFYAQVKDGNQARIPYGKGEMLINAMGISDVGQLRHIRRLLRLPQIIWTIADDLNWSENYLQKNIISIDDDETTFNGVHNALKQGYPEHLVTTYDGFVMQPDTTPVTTKPKVTYADIEASIFTKLKKRLLQLKKSDRKKAIDYLENMLDELKGE